MKRGVAVRRRNAISPMSKRPETVNQAPPQSNLVDNLVETIRNLTSNKDLLTTRLTLLNGEGLKTASIMEVAGMYRSLVSQIAVLYDTDDFQNIIAPYIQKRFVEIGSPSLTPGTIGSYIFGCYLSDYGVDSLNKFCTPICAASIRIPNRTRFNMRCTEKVIWTDGGDTPIFILIDEDPTNSQNGKVFVPWVGDASTFTGLTQGAIDEIRSFDILNIEVYGQLFNNKYIQLMSLRPLTEVTVVERIRLRSVDYVNNRNGGSTAEKIAKVDINVIPLEPEEPKPESKPEPVQEHSDSPAMEGKSEPVTEKQSITSNTYFIVGGVLIAVVFLTIILMSRPRRP